MTASFKKTLTNSLIIEFLALLLVSALEYDFYFKPILRSKEYVYLFYDPAIKNPPKRNYLKVIADAYKIQGFVAVERYEPLKKEGILLIQVAKRFLITILVQNKEAGSMQLAAARLDLKKIEVISKTPLVLKSRGEGYHMERIGIYHKP